MRPSSGGDAPRPPAGVWLAAALMLAAVRVMLTCLPYRVASRAFARASRAPRPGARTGGVTQIVHAVERASRYVPGAGHCLTKAIAVHILLGRRGHAAELCIGVLPDPRAPFPAHAWVESDGIVVIGGTDAAKRYHRLRPQPAAPGNPR